MVERVQAFVHGANMSATIDYESICEVLLSYGIKDLVVEVAYAQYTRYPSAYVPQIYADQLTPAINAAHRRGMKVHASFNVLLGSRGAAYSVVTSSETSDTSWTCPKKVISRTSTENLVKELVAYQAKSGDYAGDTIDGIMWDYIRYGDAERQDICYCSECKAAFQAWLGEGTITDWAPFKPGGTRHSKYLEWRCIPINELVRDMKTWARTINPSVEISAAVWCPVPGNPDYRKLWIGQDWKVWIQNGYLDFVSPMIYTTDVSYIASAMNDILSYFMPGKPIPLIPFMTDCFPSTVSPDTFKAEIDTIRANGSDGWNVWRYGGPGDGTGTAPDIRPYLDLVIGELPPDETPEYITPFSEELSEGNYRVTMPAQVEVGGDVYNFTGWSDGYANPQRIVTLDTDVALEAVFVKATVKISGKVIDKATEQALAGVKVTIDGYTTTTLADGTFSLNLTPGVYTATFEKNGYIPFVVQNIDVTEGDWQFSEPIQLTPIPPVSLSKLLVIPLVIIAGVSGGVAVYKLKGGG